ncbi:MAG: DHHA1 domain-containing protein, partial [Chloroflexota bacterium]
AANLPLRKATNLKEDIRIVEITGRARHSAGSVQDRPGAAALPESDYSACGGTHVAATGQIGLIKIVRTEKVKDKTRIHFVAGERALALLEQYFNQAGRLAALMTIHPLELESAVTRTLDSLHAAQKELAVARQKLLPLEAQEIAAAARPCGMCSLALQRLDGRSPGELRALAQALSAHPGLAAVLLSLSGNKLSLVTAAHPDSGVDAAALLRALLAPLGGKGGGDRSLAQGGGPTSSAQVEELQAQVFWLVQEWA